VQQYCLPAIGDIVHDERRLLLRPPLRCHPGVDPGDMYSGPTSAPPSTRRCRHG
jgi:hypothetical protein